MKHIATLSLLLTVASSGAAIAQSDGMKNMDMMKGMEMDKKAQGASKAQAAHKATGTVKKTDPEQGRAIIAHGPVESLKWPAMTMGFAVKDKALFDKLAVGKKLDVEFVQQGADYVITAVK